MGGAGVGVVELTGGEWREGVVSGQGKEAELQLTTANICWWDIRGQGREQHTICMAGEAGTSSTHAEGHRGKDPGTGAPHHLHNECCRRGKRGRSG